MALPTLFPSERSRQPFPAALTPALAGRPCSPDCLLDAQDDRGAILAWLARYKESANTLSSFLKETDRFYRWCQVHEKSLAQVTHEDYLRYCAFLSDPQPADQWVSATKYSRSDDRWRPFTGPLSPSSIRLARSILNNLFSWLVECCYLPANPLSLAPRRDRKKPKRPLTRFLSSDLLAVMDQFFDAARDRLSADTAVDPNTGWSRDELERARWCMAVFYLSGARISELAHGEMQHFQAEAVKGQLCWWLHVIGKGDKWRKVPVAPDLLSALIRYRTALGLTPLPAPGDTTPLVGSIRPSRQAGGLSRSSLHRIIKDLVGKIADALAEPGTPEALYQAEHLRQASAHWFRHSYGTALADSGADIRTIQENLGHEDVSTTSIYMHQEDRRRFRDSQGLGFGKPSGSD